MTLTIRSPYPGGPIGPGIRSDTQSINEDVPSGSAWAIEVVDFFGPPEQVSLRHQFPATAGVPVAPYFLLGDPAAGTLTFPSLAVRAVQGDEVDYRIRLISGSTGLTIDEATTPGVWDPSWAFRLPAQGGGTGGFTDADRAELVLVKSAVYRDEGTLTPGGLPLISQAIDLVRGPPMSILRRGTSQPLSGRGVLAPLRDGNGAITFGASWSWFTIPAGFGAADGQLAEYYNRMAQFLVVREAGDDSLYIDEVVDSHAEGGFLQWKFPSPTEVRYDIAPGLTLIWQWLIT